MKRLFDLWALYCLLGASIAALGWWALALREALR